MISKGDQYYYPIKISQGSTVIAESTSNLVGVKIKIANTQKEWIKNATNNAVHYNTLLKCWMYPITQSESLNYQKTVPVQAQIKISDTIISTPVRWINVNESIIRLVWSNG